MSKTKTSAADLLARLQYDEKWKEQYAERLKKAKLMEEESHRLQKELLEDLRSVGYDLYSVWDLVNTREKYPQAIPVLVKHLTRDYPDPVKEGIARSLTVKESIGFSGDIINALQQLDDSTFPRSKWALANALTVVAEPGDTGSIEAMLQDQSQAVSHDRLVAALERLQKKKH